MANVQMRLRRKPLVQLILAALCTTSAPLAFAQSTGDLSGTDGYLTDVGQRRDNFHFKLDKPIGDYTVVTLFATYIRICQNASLGATAARFANSARASA